MIVVLIALLVLVVGLAVAAVIGRLPVTTMDDAIRSSPYEPLPEGPVEGTDIEALRFDQTLRGYRMTQVDGVLDRLHDELLVRDREIAELREQLRAAPVAD